MSATDISKMNDKQLRNEVQLLRDELAIMKRQYEDIIYNLDDDNFSSRFVKEKGDMRTAIEVNAEGIKTKVSNEDFESEKKQTANLIESKVTDLTNADKELSTKITQTAETITSEVKKLTDADDAMSKELTSKIEQNAEMISTEVTALKDRDETLYSKITQTAATIRQEVWSETNKINAKFVNYSTIEQTSNAISVKVEEVKEYAEGYVTNALGEYVTNATLQTQFDIQADGIYSEVSEIYETKSDANSSYSSLSGSISTVRQTANKISTKVEKVNSGQFTDGSKDSSNNEIYYTLFEQDADSFTFDGKYMYISASINLCDNSGSHAFSFFHDQSQNSTNLYSKGIVYLNGVGDNAYTPIVIGNSSTTNTQPVCLYSYNDNNRIATQGWVLENAGSGGSGYAVFG